MRDAKTMGDTMLHVFRAYGAEHIFSSPGSEWVPLWEALARAKAEGEGPTFLNTRHEMLAVALAVGYHRQARKLPIVALHNTVGTLNAAMALRTALHERVPMVVLAGQSAGYGEMPGPDPGHQWARMLSDVGGPSSMARPFVKRSSAVTSREVLPGMLQDACRLALTPPRGPVFVSVPLEFMLGAFLPLTVRCAPPPAPVCPTAEALEHVAAALAAAERPLLITEYAGRDPHNMEALVGLAESLAMPVVETRGPVCLNFPRDHALHQGFDAGPLLDEADVVLLVGCQMPWYPSSRGPRNARVILVDDDPSHELLHYWAPDVDDVLGGDLAVTLRLLTTYVKALTPGSGAAQVVRGERWLRWETRHTQQREEWRALASQTARRRPIDSQWAALMLGGILPRDAIVIDETLTQRKALLRHLKRSVAGTYHSCSNGGLGTGVGVALGLKLAAPDRLVVAIEGDGAFNYNPILAAFGFAQQFQTPILVAIMNNGGYAEMKRAHVEYYPEGWAVQRGTFFATEIEPSPDYVAIARAFGGYGERVEEPDLLPDALRRAIERVENGQLALLDLVVDAPAPRQA